MIRYSTGYYRNTKNQPIKTNIYPKHYTQTIDSTIIDTKKEIPIFCINLERAKERKSSIEQKWILELGLNINFWNAYDRRQIEQGNHIFEYDENQTKKNIGRELSAGEIACVTSFASLYKHILDSDMSEVLIMEDDVFPLFNNKKELFDIIEQGKFEFPNATMMLLHEYYAFGTSECEDNKIFFSMCTTVPFGNQFFYANRECIKNLYDLILPIKNPADWPQRILANNHKVIMVNRPLCFHYWSGPLSTTYIGNNLRGSDRRFIE